MEKFKEIKKEGASKLPKTPGVYVFKKGREFFYIGKAVNIKKRVKDHFLKPSFKVEKIGYIKTDSEIEALLLEAQLIKKYRPKYNIVWKDDKNYFYAAITKEDFPRVFITHQPNDIKSQKSKIKTIYVGPFVDGKALKITLKSLRKAFPFRSCKILPNKPCLWYQIKRCPAPCLTKTKLGKQLPVSQMKKECQKNAKNLKKILQAKKVITLSCLKREMKELAKKQEFEKAAKIRNQIQALEKVLSNAKLELIKPTSSWENTEKELKKILKTRKRINRIEAYDVSNIQGQKATGSMITFIKGKPDKNFYRRFKIKISGKPNDIAMLKECLIRRIKHLEWGLPDLILIDGGKAQLNAARKCLNLKFKQVGVMALAKKKNELFIAGQKKSILLKNVSRGVFNLILQLRDEAHRFAITYHKKLRKIDLIPKS